jgi:hypothetical protein
LTNVDLTTLGDFTAVYLGINETIFEVLELQNENGKTVFRLKFNGEKRVNNETQIPPVEFITFDNPIGSFNYVRPVVAEWVTGVSDLGSNLFGKKVQSITVSTEPNVNSVIDFGVQTRNIEKLFGTRGTKLFSFEDIDFDNFSFATSVFTNSFTVHKPFIRNFNYILFRFRSDIDSECAVNSITLVYTVINKNRGVK